MPNSKFTTLIQHVPKAIKNGAEILTDCMVTRILVDNNRKVTGVEFNHEGNYYKQLAKIVIVSAFAVETPRLLLNSACPQYPDGLANSSGVVGKYLMPHSGHDIVGKFDEEIRFYKGTPIMASTQEFYETDLSRGFVRGYSLNAHGFRPVALAKNLAVGAGYWGKELRQMMMDLNFYALVSLVGEVLPRADNTVTLSDEKDEYGLPRPIVTFSFGENDYKLIRHGIQKANAILAARGGQPAFVLPDTGHLMGTCRMGGDPKMSAVNGFCQSHDIPNLFICDASVFVTSGAGNPTETVLAIAARTADYLISKMGKGKIEKAH